MGAQIYRADSSETFFVLLEECYLELQTFVFKMSKI